MGINWIEIAVVAAVVFIFGASVGSFLNVVVYRLPAGLSLIHPPSHCPKCQTRLKPYDNVPVFGWLWLRGRCRYCRVKISPRYPLVELGTGLLFVAVFLAFGTEPVVPGYWVLVSWLVALALIDLDTFTLPNGLTQSGLILGLVFQASVTQAMGGGLGAIAASLMAAAVAAVLGIWLFDAIGFGASMWLGQPAMGGGDGKLAAMLGAWLGWQGLLLTIILACVLGAGLGGGAIALGIIQRRQPIPFGPFLAVAALVALFWGEALIGAYLGLFFPLGW